MNLSPLHLVVTGLFYIIYVCTCMYISFMYAQSYILNTKSGSRASLSSMIAQEVMLWTRSSAAEDYNQVKHERWMFTVYGSTRLGRLQTTTTMT